MKYSLNPNTNAQRCLEPLFENQCLFFLTPVQDQQNGKQTFDYHPNYSGIILRVHILIFP